LSGLSIKVRVLLLTLVPLLIISSILGYYMAVFRLQDADNSLQERGSALARHLARESEFGLFSEDSRQLTELANHALLEQDVYEVIIMNSDKRIIAYSYSSEPGGIRPEAGDILNFTSPIYRSSIIISDDGDTYKKPSDASVSKREIIGWIELKISKSSTAARQSEILKNIMILTVGSALFCALISLWMSKSIVTPLIRLSRAVDNIRKGMLRTRVPAGSGGEIGELEHGFNDMAAAMESAQMQLHNEVKSATNKLSLLLESLPVAVFRADITDGCDIDFITPNIKQLTGFEADEFKTHGPIWLERMHPDDRNEVLSGLDLIKECGSREFEYRWHTSKDGYHWFYSHIRRNELPENDGIHVIGMWQDITEFKNISCQLNKTIDVLREKNNQLDLSRQEAVAASRDKANFLANMSHEIRTPLSAIIGYTSRLESLIRNIKTDDTLHECVRIIGHASSQLKRIIDDILNFSRLESKMVRLDQISYDLRTDFEDVVSMMSAELADGKVELSLLIDSDVPTKLVGDSNRVNQVLMNLLSNAIKFTETGSINVHVSLRKDFGDQVEIEVRVTDTGIGMSQEIMRNIFNPFHQGDASISRRYGGTGLGLSIISKLIELWDGKIGVESEPGKGSVFWFTLRCLKQGIKDDFPVDNDLKGKKILLYDDHLPVLRAVRNLLLAWSVNVYQARSRCQIQSMIEASEAGGEPYNLVIIGIGVSDEKPDHASLNELLKRMRKNHPIPILLMINHQSSISLDEACDDTVITMEKPMRRDVLYQNICKLFKIYPYRSGYSHADAHYGGPGDDSGYDGMRVLLAEDNEFNRSLLTAVLEARRVIVTQACDGRQALIHAREKDYDLIILDIHLPEMDGIETARSIRMLKPIYESIPIIALTADIFINDPQKLAVSGIDACLLKPLDEERLWKLINTLRPLARAQPRRLNKTPGVGESTLDIKMAVHQIADVPGYASLLPALLSSLKSISNRLEYSPYEQNSETLARLIHELKGIVCYFGITELSRSVSDVEKLIVRKAELTDMDPLLLNIRKEINEFLASKAGRLHASLSK
jgi:signal transduction histidine kinase/CheY-like chemotaxis protein